MTVDFLLDDERERMYIETLDTVYEDMESLSNLDVTNTILILYYTNTMRITY